MEFAMDEHAQNTPCFNADVSEQSSRPTEGSTYQHQLRSGLVVPSLLFLVTNMLISDPIDDLLTLLEGGGMGPRKKGW
jgi:hypothetical protein